MNEQTTARESDVCPNEWKVRGFVRSSHSMFHPSTHECAREYGHRGRCRCSCGRTTANPYISPARASVQPTGRSER